AATIADAWHWFDAAQASSELARVLRPGGVVAILWQYPRADALPEWSHALGEILLPLRGEHPGFAQQMTGPEDHAAFAPRTEQAVPFTFATDRERYCDYVSSISYIARLAEDERADVLARVGALLPDGPIALRYETRVWLTRRLRSART